MAHGVREPRYIPPVKIIGAQPDLFGGPARELIATPPRRHTRPLSFERRYWQAVTETDAQHRRPLYLVACVKSKGDAPAKAADLYTSDWFRKARAYVEAVGEPWAILSAEHGVIAPDRMIAPYERSLSTMKAEERRQWGARVVAQLAARPQADRRRFVLLAGEHYREALEAWAGSRASVPMRGLGLGEQKAWLAAELARILAG